MLPKRVERLHTLSYTLRTRLGFTYTPDSQSYMQFRACYTSDKSLEQKRQFPANGYEIIDQCIKLEEEQLPCYEPSHFYPVRLGQIFKDRYQVVAKLGYGSTSTTWLGRDLQNRRYVTLKVHINSLPRNQGLHIYQHLKALGASNHIGQFSIRMLKESFQLRGPHGSHDVFVLPPLGISLKALQERMPGEVFYREFVKAAIQQSLPALDFLHTDAGITHTNQDLHSGNLLVGISDESVLAEYEVTEFERPTPRKESGDTTIYVSRLLLSEPGPLHLCDFGGARIGSEHEGVAMPIQYRAPEVLLGMKWGHAVDMWSLGLMAWDLLESSSLFQVYDGEDKEANEAHHLANMVALLGPPPAEFLSRSDKSRKYWNDQGIIHEATSDVAVQTPICQESGSWDTAHKLLMTLPLLEPAPNMT
ncbi:putative serine/threonine-protein kinase clkA-like protein [Cladobotryum mycophilum]|uniref:non-specific serine/threonine protein kinase n=1 Tax=Cladobotryum mycophilum TaxID=491253 RepID=A0ABR0SC69_9HYPO